MQSTIDTRPHYFFNGCKCNDELPFPFSPKLHHHHLFQSFSSGTNGRTLAVSSSLDGISVGFPKPEVIEWQKDLSNSVSLIGTLGNNVVIKYLDSGKVMAHCIIKVKRSGISASKDDSV